jgi:hypothetical protein
MIENEVEDKPAALLDQQLAEHRRSSAGYFTLVAFAASTTPYGSQAQRLTE